MCIDISENPHLKTIYDVISQAFNRTVPQNPILPLSYDGMIKRMGNEKGQIAFEEMEDDMKISHSKFSHYYTKSSIGKEMVEVIIQDTGTKIAVFSEEVIIPPNKIIIYSEE